MNDVGMGGGRALVPNGERRRVAPMLARVPVRRPAQTALATIKPGEDYRQHEPWEDQDFGEPQRQVTWREVLASTGLHLTALGFAALMGLVIASHGEGGGGDGKSALAGDDFVQTPSGTTTGTGTGLNVGLDGSPDDGRGGGKGGGAGRGDGQAEGNGNDGWLCWSTFVSNMFGTHVSHGCLTHERRRH